MVTVTCCSTPENYIMAVDLWVGHIVLSLQAISNKEQHSISYTLSRAQTVVVEYTHDNNTDMFQVCAHTHSMSH